MPKTDFNILISSNKEDHDSVLKGLTAYNVAHVGPSRKTELTFQIKDDAGNLIAGANGFTSWNYFYLSHLWVSESKRGSGIGKHLLKRIESEAVARQCTHCWVDTFYSQAATFYEKLGYTRFGHLDNYAAGYPRLFYCKRL
jgi:GNAT superfamily N-acetyltransferase